MHEYLNGLIHHRPLSDIEKSQLIIDLQNGTLYSFIKDKLFSVEVEESLWEQILNILPIDCISDSLVQFLIKNKLALVTLGHLSLSDKWLYILAEYDDEPKYQLSDRFATERQIDSDVVIRFLQFAERDCRLYEYTLEQCRIDTEQWKVAIFYGLHSHSEEIVSVSKDAYERALAGTAVDPEWLRTYYLAHSQEGKALLAISQNCYTPEDILQELEKTKSILLASKIRESSRKTRTFIQKMAREARKDDAG